MAAASKSQAYRIAKRVDLDLSALFSALSSTSTYGADGQTLTDDIILDIMQTLDEADVPDDGTRVIIGDSSTRVDMLKIDKFVRNDYVRNPAIATGQIGDIYNMKVKITNNLTAATTGNYGVMMHKDALGLVIQANPKSEVIPMPWEHRIILQTKIIYGVAEIRDTFGKSFYTHHA